MTQWWRRAKATLKDKRSVYISRVTGGRRRSEIDSAVIRATDHDDRSVDYKNAARVFAWARTSPDSLPHLLRALIRRANRTRSWVVALKTLLLAHGILLCSVDAPRIGRLPFDLSDFRDRSARPPAASYGFSAFVRAYFQFLDFRSSSLSQYKFGTHDNNISVEQDVQMLVKMQDLLELLMQIRPYADGMEVGLILEAMNCVVIEIFEVYSSICRGIGCFLVHVVGTSNSSWKTGVSIEERRRFGVAGMKLLRRAAEQNEQLSTFFGLCRSLGVLNAAEIPPVESIPIPEEDIRDLEALLRAVKPDQDLEEDNRESHELSSNNLSEIVSEEWVVFEDDTEQGIS